MPRWGTLAVCGGVDGQQLRLRSLHVERLDQTRSCRRGVREGFGSGPKEPSVLSTRGAILVELGKVEEGKKLLKRALRIPRSQRDKMAQASTLASLALASACMGRRAWGKKGSIKISERSVMPYSN